MPIRIATLEEGAIAYRDSGPTTGPALVFAHSMGFDQRSFDLVTALLPKSLRVVSYDLRGHGQSEKLPSPYSMGALIRDAERLMDHLGLRDSVFCGCSLGGMVAQGLAVKRLDLIRGLILANTAAKIGTKESWSRLIREAQENGMAARFEKDLTQSFSAAFRGSPLLKPWAEILAGFELDSFLGCASAISGTDFYTTTASLRLPCLVVASSDDAITPADMVRDLADLIPGSRFALIRKSGHLPQIEQPQAFASVLTDFLQSIGHH